MKIFLELQLSKKLPADDQKRIQDTIMTEQTGKNSNGEPSIQNGTPSRC